VQALCGNDSRLEAMAAHLAILPLEARDAGCILNKQLHLHSCNSLWISGEGVLSMGQFYHNAGIGISPAVIRLHTC